MDSIGQALNNEQCGDDARKLIPPLNLRGTTDELDNGFFERITTPMQIASGLMVDMEGFIETGGRSKETICYGKRKDR